MMFLITDLELHGRNISCIITACLPIREPLSINFYHLSSF